MIILFTLLSSTTIFFVFLFNQQVKFFSFIIKFLINVYDQITLPIYYLIDKPWIKLNKFKSKAKRIYEPNGDYTYWVNHIPITTPQRYKQLEKSIGQVKHLSELVSIIKHSYHDQDSIGERKILNKITENGRTKFELGDYEWINYNQAVQKIYDLAKILDHKFQFKRGDQIAIMADTCFEWISSLFALQLLGCQLVTMHSTLDDESICYILNSTDVKYIFTQADLVKTLNKLKPKLEKLSTLIVYDNPFIEKLNDEEKKNSNFELFDYDQLLKESKHLPELNFNNNMNYSPDDVAVMMFTSGSTGNAKGVLLTHTNIIESLIQYMRKIPFALNMDIDDIFLAYLPMSHIFEMMCEIIFFTTGGKIAYGRPGTLVTKAPLLVKGCKGDIQSSKASIWAGVPLIFERIKNQLQTLLKQKSPLVDSIYQFAYQYKIKWTARGYNCSLVDKLLFKRIQDEFGGNLKYVITGGAPLSIDTQTFVKEFLNVKLLLAYAATECSVACLSTLDNTNHTLSMNIHDGTKIRLDDWDEGGYKVSDQPNARGELIVSGRSVSIGYYNNPEETEKAFFIENDTKWWRTGDIGEIDEDGNVTIIDRKKDLVKLQFGKYIALGKVEAVFKNCVYVENIVLHCNSLFNYLTAILQPDLIRLLELAKSLGKETDDINKLCNDKDIKEAILKELMKYGKSNGLSTKELPYVIKIVPEIWSSKNGLLTASLKTRRAKIYAYYKDSIDELYNELKIKYPNK